MLPMVLGAPVAGNLCLERRQSLDGQLFDLGTQAVKCLHGAGPRQALASFRRAAKADPSEVRTYSRNRSEAWPS